MNYTFHVISLVVLFAIRFWGVPRKTQISYAQATHCILLKRHRNISNLIQRLAFSKILELPTSKCPMVSISNLSVPGKKVTRHIHVTLKLCRGRWKTIRKEG